MHGVRPSITYSSTGMTHNPKPKDVGTREGLFNVIIVVSIELG